MKFPLQALTTMFMHEMEEPFDLGAPHDGRESKASSYHSAGRTSSIADLSENGWCSALFILIFFFLT